MLGLFELEYINWEFCSPNRSINTHINASAPISFTLYEVCVVTNYRCSGNDIKPGQHQKRSKANFKIKLMKTTA